jgi:acetyl-CoA synthetase (ADP-forming)
VRLDLRDAEAVAEAFDGVTAAARRTAPGDAVEGCYVQRMITGEAELIVGVRRDAQFGPLVLAGSGGLFAEIVRDTCVALAPVSTARALEMLRELRMWPLLDGTRGRPPLDAAAAAEVVSRMSWLAADLGARLVDLEANPVLVRRAGEGAVAVDTRGTLQDGATAPDGATGGGHG